MIDLTQAIGLPVQLDPDTLTLRFGKGVGSVGQEDVHYGDLASMLLNAESSGPDLIYRHYPQVYRHEDENLLRSRQICLELTVMAPGCFGTEPLKTCGHYHNLVPGTSFTYPVIKEVVHGKCHFLLQKADPPYERISDAVLLMGEARERVVIPPGYGHLEINPTDGPVVLATVHSTDLTGLFEPYIQRKGACYYATKAENTLLFVPNAAYPDIPTLRVGRAHELPDFALTGQTLYRSVVQEPDRFELLNHPHRFKERFSGLFDFTHVMHGLLL